VILPEHQHRAAEADHERVEADGHAAPEMDLEDRLSHPGSAV
jgi:hypothetical protein